MASNATGGWDHNNLTLTCQHHQELRSRIVVGIGDYLSQSRWMAYQHGSGSRTRSRGGLLRACREPLMPLCHRHQKRTNTGIRPAKGSVLQQSRYRYVFVDVRPVNPHALSDQPPVAPLLRTGVS